MAVSIRPHLPAIVGLVLAATVPAITAYNLLLVGH